MHIYEVDEVDDELVDAMARLLPQLTESYPPPTRSELEEIVASPATALLAARRDAPAPHIVGTLTLVYYRLPTRLQARLEDVVVDRTARRQGIGRQLTEAAIDHARRRGARGIELTSNPAREAAHRLYADLGFAPYETNVYKYRLEE